MSVPASVFLETLAHSVAHLVIFAGYILAVFVVTPAFRRLLKVNRVTMLGGGLFFLCCGVTHLGISLGYEQQTRGPWPFLLNDVLQAIAIWAFIIGLNVDIVRAGRRLVQAQIDIREGFRVRTRQIAEHPGPIDAWRTSEQMARWTTSRILGAFMDLPAAPPPEINEDG